MINLSLNEAQLFRMLVGFFGRDHVVPQMSVTAVCGGKLPEDVSHNGNDLGDWARRNNCLFTIVDKDDAPRLVIEFASGFSDAIDAVEAEHQSYLRPILDAAGIHYVTISDAEFAEMTDPAGQLDLVSFLKAKFGYEGLDVS